LTHTEDFVFFAFKSNDSTLREELNIEFWGSVRVTFIEFFCKRINTTEKFAVFKKKKKRSRSAMG